MQALDTTRLRAVHLVPLTAFTPAGQINERVQQEHIARLSAAGIRVLMPGAGTGEFHSLSADEIVRLVAITREAAGREAIVFAPVGLQIGHAIAVGKQARAAGADGVLFMPFSHPYMHDAGARDYYTSVLRELDCPALIYKNAPVPSDALLLELSSLDQVVGVKYSLNNLQDFRRTVLADEGRIEWLCGSAERFAPYYTVAGATGYTSGAGNLCPRLTLAMHAALAAGQYDEGLRLQQELLPIEDFRARDGDSFNISMLKYAMSHLGLDFGAPRPPQRQLDADQRREVDRLLVSVFAAEQRLP